MPYQFAYRKLYILNRKKKTVHDKRLTINYKRGLTLIELLLAITLVSILAGIIAFSMVGQQRKARDAQRKNDLQQVKRALESSKNDCQSGSYYPIVPSGSTAAETFNTTAGYLSNSVIKLMDTTVSDPKNPTSVYTIHYPATLADNVCPDTSGTRTTEGARTYVLRAQMEISNDPDTNKSRTACASKIGSGVGQIPTSSFTPVPAASDGYFYVCPD